MILFRYYYYYYPIFSDCTVFYWCGGCGRVEFLSDACAGAFIWFVWWKYCGISFCIYLEFLVKKEAVPKVMSATLNVVVSINSTTVMQTYWTAPSLSRPALATITNAGKPNCICKYLYYFLKSKFKFFLHYFVFIIKERKPYQNISVFFFHYDIFKTIFFTDFFEEFFFPAVIVVSC